MGLFENGRNQEIWDMIGTQMYDIPKCIGRNMIYLQNDAKQHVCFDWEAGAKSLDSGTRQTYRPIWRDCLLVETDNPIQFHHYLSNLTLVTSAFLIGSLCNIFQFWVVKFHEISPPKKDPHSFWSRRRLPVAAPTPFGSGCSGLEMDQPRTC